MENKYDFIKFVESLLNELENSPETWENKTLPDFLGAMISWIEDMEGYYINNNLPIPEDINWKVMGDILAAARIYE